MANEIRLDKYLSEMNVESRSKIKLMVKAGRVKVNGSPAKKPEQKVNTDTDVVEVDGTRVIYEEMQYFLLHKPAGVVTATEDRFQNTVMELLPDIRRSDLSPVGRLDKDTEGLLLITNDGALNHRLLSPKHHVEKCYFARIQGVVTPEDQRLFAEGVDIQDDTLTAPAKLEILSSGEISEIKITITEGRYHQIKRMFEAVGKSVVYLKRLSMGSLWLDEELELGCCRKLTLEELELLKG